MENEEKNDVFQSFIPQLNKNILDEQKNEEWLDQDGKLKKDVVISDISNLFQPIVSNGGIIFVWLNDHYDSQGREILSKYVQNHIPEISARVVSDIVEAIYNINFRTKEQLDAMKLPESYIPVRNGLIDWSKKSLLPHTPIFFYFARLGVNFKPDVYPLNFINYLLSRFEKNFKNMLKVLEDLALAHFRSNRYQIIPIWVGLSKDEGSGLISGEEGKTLTAEILWGQKYFSTDLWTNADLHTLIEHDNEWIDLKGKWFHTISIDEGELIRGFARTIEKLRDPGFKKPVKYAREQQYIENTALHILIGNIFPSAENKTKAMYRSINQIVEWRKPIGSDFKIIDLIDEDERSGILNLAIDFMNFIAFRGTFFGKMDLSKTVEEYTKISEPLVPLLNGIFVKDKDARIEQGQAYQLVLERAMEEEIVEKVTKTKITVLLKRLFGATPERTTRVEETKDESGNLMKTKKHIDYYSGIKIKNNVDSGGEVNSDTNTNSDTLEEAVMDYILSLEKNGISEYPKNSFPDLYVLYIIVKERSKMTGYTDTQLLNLLENTDFSNSQNVSDFFQNIRVLKNNKNNPSSLPASPAQNPHSPSLEDEQKLLKNLVENLKSRGFSINETASGMDSEKNRFLIYVLEPYRPDSIMAELGFHFVNQSKEGVLYEKYMNIQTLQGGT